MKGIFTALALMAPVTAIILYFVLFQTDQVREDQARQDIGMRLDEAKFDKDFDSFDADISGNSLSKEKTAAHDKRISDLEDKFEDADRKFDESFFEADRELKQMRKELDQFAVSEEVQP